MDTLNTNVGDMPLDIFSDYLTDTLDQEWHWEYLALAINGQGYSNNIEHEIHGCGFQTIDHTYEVLSYGDGAGTPYGVSLLCYNESVDRYYGDGESNSFGNGQNYIHCIDEFLGNG